MNPIILKVPAKVLYELQEALDSVERYSEHDYIKSGIENIVLLTPNMTRKVVIIQDV